MRILGISEGDEDTVLSAASLPRYVMVSGFRSFLRLLANHCIIPSMRVVLFRWSGIGIGKKVQINMNTNFLDGFRPGWICLEDETSVAPFVSFVSESHPNNSILYREFKIRRQGKILVKRGAWIGTGAVILPGVTVGKAAIIGANAVVTRDVEDYAVMVGIPARKQGDVREGSGKPRISCREVSP